MSTKISQLPEATTLADANEVPAVASGATKKFKLSTLYSYIIAKINSAYPALAAINGNGDYVVRRGTSNGWQCEYWDSGIVKAKRTQSVEMSSPTVIRNDTLRKNAPVLNLPSTFLTIDNWQVTANMNESSPWWFATVRQANMNGVRAICDARVQNDTVLANTITLAWKIEGTYDRSIFS